MIINTPSLEEAKQQIKKSSPPIVILSQSLEFNRKIIEYGKFQSLIFPNPSIPPRLSLRKIDINLDTPALKSASKNKISITIDLKTMPKSKKQKALFLLQILELIKLSKKTKTELLLKNAKNKQQARSLLTSLNASSQQTKKAITF